MGNVGREPQLSELFFGMDMNQQRKNLAHMLEDPSELENTKLDLELFLGTGDYSDLIDDGISLSSCDTDEFDKLLPSGVIEEVKFSTQKEDHNTDMDMNQQVKKLAEILENPDMEWNQQRNRVADLLENPHMCEVAPMQDVVIKEEIPEEKIQFSKHMYEVAPVPNIVIKQEVLGKKVQFSKHLYEVAPVSNVVIKQEVLDEKEQFNESEIDIERNVSIKEEVSEEDEKMLYEENESTDIYYIASKKRRGRKRKNRDYCKRRRSKPDKELKIVIKRKEIQSGVPNPIAATSIKTTFPSPTISPAPEFESVDVDSSPNAFDSPTSINPYNIPFSDFYSTSIAEKVKTKRRCNIKNNSSEMCNINSFGDIKDEEKSTKKQRNFSSGKRKNSRAEDNHNQLTGLPQTTPKIKIQLNRIVFPKPDIVLPNFVRNSTKQATKSLEISNNVPSLNFNSNRDSLDVTHKSVEDSKVSLSYKADNLHDYSKPLLPNNNARFGKKVLQNIPSVVPVECKSTSLKSDMSNSSLRFGLRRTSNEDNPIISNAQESLVVPVSMAELEVASFEDAVEVPVEYKSNYNSKLSSRFPDLSSAFPHKKLPIILLTPLSNTKAVASENLRIRHSSSESSSPGYHSGNSISSSPGKVSPLFLSQWNKPQKPQSQPEFESSSPPGLKKTSQHDTALLNRLHHLKNLMQMPEPRLPANDGFSSNSMFSLRPSTRSQTKSPVKLSHQSNSKSKREINQRSQRTEEKEDEQEARRMAFDNRKAIEERRVMYVGKIPEGFTEDSLNTIFGGFGEIENIQMKARESEPANECGSVIDHEYGDWNLTANMTGLDKGKKSYGFITFKRQSDVARAIEGGNRQWPGLKLNYGGRREFVKVNYSDLDGNFAEKIDSDNGYSSKNDDYDFSRELKAAQQRRGIVPH